MDEILKSEVIVVALERKEGVTFEEFSGLFHQVHGYQLKLTNYGYKSLKDLLDDMKVEIELQNVNGQQMIKYRPPCQPNVIPPCMDISSQKNDPYMSDTCNASSSNCWSQSGDIPLDEFPMERPSYQQNAAGISGHNSSHPAIQSTVQSWDYLTMDFTMDTCFTTPQMPSKEIVQIISQKMKSHPTGLKTTKLKQYMLEKHRIDLECYSQVLGYTDMLSMLKEIPAIKFPNTSGKNIIIASCFYKNQFEDQHKASAKEQLSNASTSSSTPSAKRAAQPDVSSSQKKANKEPLLSTASPSQENGPLIPETCTASSKNLDSMADHLLTRRVNHTQPISSHKDPKPTLLVDDHSPKHKSLNTTQKPSKEIAKIISDRVTLSHHLGLKAKTLKQYIMSQYKFDLEQYSKQLGYTDMLSMLKQIPGIGFAHNSKTNLLIALGPHEKHHNSQPAQPKKDPWKKVADVLRLFPSGLRAEKLKQHVLNTHQIDLEVLSQELGYTDMLHMLKKVPDITSLNGEVFIASVIHKPKSQPVQVKKFKFSEKCMVDFLKTFPSGLKVERLSQHMKNKYNIDLIKYSQEKGSTDMVFWLQNITGITVMNKNLVIASDVYKKSNSKPNATCKIAPAKCPINAGTGVTKKPHVGMKTARGSQAVPIPSTTRPTRTGQNIPLPIGQIPLTNAMNSPQNVQPGLRPNVSYASACANNLRKNQNNVPSEQCPPTFNVQKAHTAKAARPNYKEAPKAVLPSSKIKDNLQLLVKSHTNGLSIFRLKKLYLLEFQQPLVLKGLSARKLLMGLKDVAEIKGVGVQMKVFPVLSEDPSASANTCRDSIPQGAAALEANDGKNNKVLTHLQVSSPLSIKNSTEHMKHCAPVPLSNTQPSSSGYNQTESTGRFIPISSSEDINHKQPLNHNHSQPMTQICGKQLVTTTISHQANSSSVLASQFSKMYESPQTTGIAANLSDTQWPSLPQKLNILKEITQGARRPQQLHKNIPNNELSFKQNPTATSKPQEKDNSAQTSLQAHQSPYKTNGKTDYRQQEGQTLDLVHSTVNSGFSFVLEEIGFSLVKENTNIDKDKTSMEIGRNVHATPLHQNQSAYCNMAAPTKGSAPDGSSKSVNVLMQQKMADFNSKTVTQQKSNDLVTSRTINPICSMPNQKSTDSQSQRNTTSVCNKNVDSLLSELKQLQATCASSQTGVTSLQSQGIQPSCASGQTASMPSTGQQEASSSKSICDFGQRGSTPSPSKQEVAESNLTNRCGLTVSPKAKSPKKVPNPKTVTKVGTQHIPTKNSLSVTQTTSNDPPESSPVSHSQQNVLVNPSVNSEGSPISHLLHRDIDLNTADRQIGLKTQKQEHSQIRDGADGAKTPLPSAQQIGSTGHVYTHEQTVTEPFQTQAKVPHPHTSSPVEQSRPLAKIHHYYNGTAERPLGLEKSFTSKSYQHTLDSLHSGIPSQSEFPMTPSDQEDNSDYSSEESTQTWQTDSGQSCCIL